MVSEHCNSHGMVIVTSFGIRNVIEKNHLQSICYVIKFPEIKHYGDILLNDNGSSIFSGIYFSGN